MVLLMGNISVKYRKSTEQDNKVLQVVYLAEKSLSRALACPKYIYTSHFEIKAGESFMDCNHEANSCIHCQHK